MMDILFVCLLMGKPSYTIELHCVLLPSELCCVCYRHIFKLENKKLIKIKIVGSKPGQNVVFDKFLVV